MLIIGNLIQVMMVVSSKIILRLSDSRTKLVTQPIVKAFCRANQVRNNRLALDFFGSGGNGFQRLANFAAFLAIIQRLNRLVLQILDGTFDLVFLRHPLFCPSVVVILKKYSRSVQVLFHYASQPLHKQVYTPGKLPTLRINQRKGERLGTVAR